MADYCDERLWLEGFEAAARACIEAMPADQRGRFDRVFFSGPDAIEAMGHYVPERHRERGIVYFVGIKGARYVFIPVARPFVEDVASGAPLSLLGRLEVGFFGDEAA